MISKQFIKDHPILIFDMGKTFMFNGDRFNNTQNYESSYRALGGENLDNKQLHDLFFYIYDWFLARTRNPLYFDDIPTLRSFLDIDKKFNEYENSEKDLIEKTFAHHECGVVPCECKDVLFELSKTHKLGIISNVWCNSGYFTERLKTDEVYDLFDLILFSSDNASVKPSPKLFNMASKYFGVNPAEIIYIGDNYKRDVIGSKNAGMKSIWVNPNGFSPDSVKPDYEVKHIRELTD